MTLQSFVRSAGALVTATVALSGPYAALAQQASCEVTADVPVLTEASVRNWIDSYSDFVELSSTLPTEYGITPGEDPVDTLERLAETGAIAALNTEAANNGFGGFCDWLRTTTAIVRAHAVLEAPAADRGMMMVDDTVAQNADLVRRFAADVGQIADDL